jgi:hypothetical protein
MIKIEAEVCKIETKEQLWRINKTKKLALYKDKQDWYTLSQTNQSNFLNQIKKIRDDKV